MRLALLAILAVGLLAALPAQALVRDAWDESEFQALRTANPHLAELLERGEARGAAGALEEADAIFRQGEAENRDVSIFWRRDCEVLTALGRRKEAVEACDWALQSSRIPANYRAYVRAQVDGPIPPTTAEMTQALRFVALQRQGPPSLPTPPAMVCDIAEAIGDGVMLQSCAEELLRLAPGDPETRRAASILNSRCPPGRFWAGWLAILAAALITGVHSLRRFAQRALQPKVVVAATMLLVCLSPAVARADGPKPVYRVGTGPVDGAHPPTLQPADPKLNDRLGTWPIDEAHPDRTVPTEEARNANPFEFGYWLQDVTLMAKKASKRGDHAAAARFYKALSIAVPDIAVSFALACREYEADRDLDNAIRSCADALLRDGVTVGDYTHFVALVLSTPGKLSDNQVAALAAVIQQMRNDPAARDVVDGVECEVGLRMSNVAQLKECTKNLALSAPDDPRTITYEWALAVQEGRYIAAEKLLARAKSAGVAVDGLQQKTAADRKGFWMRVLQGVAIVVFVLTGAVLGGRRLLRRRRAGTASTVAS